MTVEDLARILLAEMEADQSTALADTILRDARSALKAGKGSIGTLTASGVNGKSFTRSVQLSCVQVIDACRRAITAYANDGDDPDEVRSTYPDFSGMTY